MSGAQGQAGATLNIEHNGGPHYAIVRVDVIRGSSGTLQALDGSTGTFVAGQGSISGSGNFTSAAAGQGGTLTDQSFTWGQPFELKAGLMASAIGDCGAEFGMTARLVAVEFFDANHAPVTDASIVSASGTAYGAPATSTSDAGAADAMAADAGDSAADAQLADARADGAMAADARAGAADAQVVDAAWALPDVDARAYAPTSPHNGGWSCGMAGGDTGGGVLLLLLPIAFVSRRRATASSR
jgi:hypothetical protein